MSRCNICNGHSFDVFNPLPGDVFLEDIAQALGNNCRYNGHVPFYSVAEHCVVASLCCDPKHALSVLMHDAAEAYLSDVPSPYKGKLDGFEVLEMEVLMTILVGLELPSIGDAGWAEIEEADQRIKAVEVVQLMPMSGPECWPDLVGVEPYRMSNIEQGMPNDEGEIVRLGCWSPWVAKARFLKRFSQLVGA